MVRLSWLLVLQLVLRIVSSGRLMVVQGIADVLIGGVVH